MANLLQSCFATMGCSPIICGTNCVAAPFIKASNWVFAGTYLQSNCLVACSTSSDLCLIVGNAAGNAWCIAAKITKGDPPNFNICGLLNTYGTVDITPTNSGKLRVNTCVHRSI